MPSRYLLLRQKSGEPCEIVLVDANKPEEILASGGRWQMRHRFDDLRKANMPEFRHTTSSAISAAEFAGE